MMKLFVFFLIAALASAKLATPLGRERKFPIRFAMLSICVFLIKDPRLIRFLIFLYHSPHGDDEEVVQWQWQWWWQVLKGQEQVRPNGCDRGWYSLHA